MYNGKKENGRMCLYYILVIVPLPITTDARGPRPDMIYAFPSLSEVRMNLCIYSVT